MKDNKRASTIFIFIIALVLNGLFFYFVLSRQSGKPLNFEPYLTYLPVILSGWIRTVYMSFMSMVASLFVGLVLYMMHQSKFRLLQSLAVIHKNIMFGTPLLVIVIVSYYMIANAFNYRNKVVVGVIILAMYIGAYVSDIYKGSVESIHMNQWQTAKMFGFSTYQTYRYVILPQVVITALPPIAGQLALTIKGSALLSLIATPEYFNQVNNVLATTFLYREGYIILAIGYLLITIPLIRLVRYLEVKLNYKV